MSRSHGGLLAAKSHLFELQLKFPADPCRWARLSRPPHRQRPYVPSHSRVGGRAGSQLLRHLKSIQFAGVGPEQHMLQSKVESSLPQPLVIVLHSTRRWGGSVTLHIVKRLLLLMRLRPKVLWNDLPLLAYASIFHTVHNAYLLARSGASVAAFPLSPAATCGFPQIRAPLFRHVSTSFA